MKKGLTTAMQIRAVIAEIVISAATPPPLVDEFGNEWERNLDGTFRKGSGKNRDKSQKAGAGLSPEYQAAMAKKVTKADAHMQKRLDYLAESLRSELNSPAAKVSNAFADLADTVKSVSSDILGNASKTVGDIVTKDIPKIVEQSVAKAKDIFPGETVKAAGKTLKKHPVLVLATVAAVGFGIGSLLATPAIISATMAAQAGLAGVAAAGFVATIGVGFMKDGLQGMSILVEQTRKRVEQQKLWDEVHSMTQGLQKEIYQNPKLPRKDVDAVNDIIRSKLKEIDKLAVELGEQEKVGDWL